MIQYIPNTAERPLVLDITLQEDPGSAYMYKAPISPFVAAVAATDVALFLGSRLPQGVDVDAALATMPSLTYHGQTFYRAEVLESVDWSGYVASRELQTVSVARERHRRRRPSSRRRSLRRRRLPDLLDSETVDVDHGSPTDEVDDGIDEDDTVSFSYVGDIFEGLTPYTGGPLPQDNDLDDKVLAERAKHGDSEAKGILYRRYASALRFRAFGFTKDEERADGIVTEAFLKAYAALPRYKSVHFRALIYRIVRNMGLNYVRDKKRHAKLLGHNDGENVADTKPTRPPTADDYATHNRREASVAESLKVLSRNHREILRLYYWEDLSYAEIARVLGVEQGTVNSRLSRARARLAELQPGLEFALEGDD